MFRRIEDFRQAWAQETEATLKIFRALTPASLTQAVAPGRRTLGRLAWHIVVTLPDMMGHAGLPVTGPAEREGAAARPSAPAATAGATRSSSIRATSPRS